jgi:hypothetical protein
LDFRLIVDDKGLLGVALFESSREVFVVYVFVFDEFGTKKVQFEGFFPIAVFAPFWGLYQHGSGVVAKKQFYYFFVTKSSLCLNFVLGENKA